MTMTYEQRMRLATNMANDFLRQWPAPTHLNAEDKMTRLRQTAEAMNANIGSQYGQEGFRSRIEDVFREVVASYRGRDWPAVAIFVDVAKATTPKDQPALTISLDHDDIAARRIIDKKPVGMTYVHGSGADRLINASKVTAADLRAYRLAFFHDAKKLYGEEWAQEMVDYERGRAASVAAE